MIRSRVAPSSQPPAHPQGVVVVIIDTLRRDHLALAGYDRDTAPHFSALAKEGVVADDAISQAPWTKVSVPSILTSLYPTSDTVNDMPDLLPASAETMAEVFRHAGFATLGFSAIPFTGKMTNLHQGYEQFRESGVDFSAVTNSTMPVEKAARRYVDELLPWIERHREVPFFAVLHVEDPHAPYVAPGPYATVWGEAGDAGRLQQMTQQVRPKIANPLLQIFGLPAKTELAAAGVDADQFVQLERDAYDGLIRETDAEIARLVERIDELGLRDRVLLAFVSDHGTEFLDHGQHFHGHTVYGELNRVPMFFWGPSYVPAGVHIPTTVQNIDFMPTVIDLAGLPIPKAAQGQSLRPWFEAEGEESVAAAKGWRRAPAITEKPLPAALALGGWASYSIISDGWKLIHNVKAAAAPPPGTPPGGPPGGGIGGPPGPVAGGPPGAPPGAPPGFGAPAAPPVPPPPEYELYDHVKDPLNLVNLAPEHPDRVKELAASSSGGARRRSRSGCRATPRSPRRRARRSSSGCARWVTSRPTPSTRPGAQALRVFSPRRCPARHRRRRLPDIARRSWPRFCSERNRGSARSSGATRGRRTRRRTAVGRDRRLLGRRHRQHLHRRHHPELERRRRAALRLRRDRGGRPADRVPGPGRGDRRGAQNRGAIATRGAGRARRNGADAKRRTANPCFDHRIVDPG